MKRKIKEFLVKNNCKWVFDFFKYSKNRVIGFFEFFKESLFSTCNKIWHYSRRCLLVGRYLKSHKIRKLQIGGGDNILEGWLNTDFMPRNNQTVILDVTRTMLFKSNTFDYIFCEHMIEHITYAQAHKMLKECLRILRPNGKLRISTPDLEVYIGLFGHQKSSMQERHIEWIGNNWLKRQGIHSPNEVFVLNLMMHGWGHKFLYDFKTLKNLLGESGFSDIRRAQVKISDDENLKGIESHGDAIKNIKGIEKQFGSKFDNEMNEFGSLTVEGSKR